MASISINVTDQNTEITEKFSAFIQEKSDVVISVVASDFSDYPVFVQCKVNFENSSYVETVENWGGAGMSNPVTFEHGKITGSGEIPIDAAATFRSANWVTPTLKKATENINVLAYSSPKITNLTCYRCNEDGTENPEGTRVNAKFSSEIVDLNGLNDKSCVLYYKEFGSETWLNAGNKTIDYVVENGELISNPVFDVEISYNVKLVVGDFFESVESLTNVSQAYTIIDFNVSGKGFAIGKVSEIPDALEFGMKTIFVGGIEYSILADGTDLNNLMFPNTYVLSSDYEYTNNPFPNSDCLVEILGRENFGLLQRVKKLDETNMQCERARFLDVEVWPDEWQYMSYDAFDQTKDRISDWIYPIGSVYLETENWEPSHFYGTWEKITFGISGVYAWKRTG